MRSSSAAQSWQNNNRDCRPINPGETLTLAELAGPGQINHIWFTIGAKDRFYPRTTVLRMYWDGQEQPSVETPLGDFFAVGHGVKRDVNSQMVAVSSQGRAYNCYWPMPFRKSAQITVTNDSDKPVFVLYWYIDWQQRPVGSQVPYFCAQYRQENPARKGRDYLIADIEGQGYYVGTVLSVRMSQPGWFGEGDDRFYIDEETEPSLQGTGTEDYFCDAWGFRKLNRPYYGVTVWEGMHRASRATAYRWHIPDPVFFDKSLKVTIEHKGNLFDPNDKLLNAYTDQRPDFYSSVAFWYQTGEVKRFFELPQAQEKVPRYQAFQAEELVDAESLDAGMEIFRHELFYEGGAILFFYNNEPGGQKEIAFPVEQTGRYVVFVKLHRRGDCGIYDIYLDGKLMRSNVDCYSEFGVSQEVKVGFDHQLDEGEHRIRFICRGANDASRSAGQRGYHLALDAIYLEPLSVDR